MKPAIYWQVAEQITNKLLKGSGCGAYLANSRLRSGEFYFSESRDGPRLFEVPQSRHVTANRSRCVWTAVWPVRGEVALRKTAHCYDTRDNQEGSGRRWEV